MSDFNAEKNRVVWFDLPVADLERAIAFYAAVLGVPVHREDMGHFSFGVLHHTDGNGGCLVPEEGHTGFRSGPLLYLNTHGRIRDAVAKTVALGGKVLEEVVAIGPHGFRAVILDSEGNRVALHSHRDG